MAEFILKDWYGKDCRFDHDKIFVQDANGNLVQFTQGKGNPVLEELRVAENGLYTPKGTVDGFNRVVVDVASEINEMLFNKTNFSGFASGDEFNGLHTKTLIVGTDIDSLKIIDGREYTVYWDDVNYTTYAKDTNYIIEEAVGGETIYRSIYYLGNGTLLGLNGAEDTGEPFALQYTQSKELLLVSTDTAETHSVAIMKRVRPRDGLEMMLQSLTVTENGTYTADSYYDGLKTVNVDVPIPEVVLQDKTITENGTFTADDGFDGLGSITVEVAGSGGGSLPVGGYFTQKEIRPPKSYLKRRFTLNGVDYLLVRTSSGAGSAVAIYKIENGVYTSVVSSATCTNSQPSMDVVELNGVAHFLDSAGTMHYVFDGTKITQKNSLPGQSGGLCNFAYNGELYYFRWRYGYYKWNASTDSWESVGQIVPDTFGYYWGFMYNDECYLMKAKTLYRISFENGTYETVKTLDIPLDIGGTYTRFVVTSLGILYMIVGNSGKEKMYKYDIENGLLTYLCEVPNLSTPALYVDNGSVCVLDNGETYTDLILHEVTE